MQVAKEVTPGTCSKPANITGLLWSDEFEGGCSTMSGIDPNNWKFQTGDGSAFGLVGMQVCFTSRMHISLHCVHYVVYVPPW